MRIDAAPSNDTIPVPPLAVVARPTYEQAVDECRDLVERLARRYAVYGADVDDARQEGYVALFAAAKTWHPTGGASFVTWASLHVRGALARRFTRERRRGFTGRLHGSRALASRATALGFSVGRATSMDQPLGDEHTMHDVLGHDAEQEDSLCEAEITGKIRAAVARLSEKDRAMWALVTDGETCEAIGDRLGMSSCNVSHRMAKISDEIAKLIQTGEGAPGHDRRDAHSQQLTHDGQTMSVPAWGRRQGLAPRIILKRLATGWSVADALTTPVDASKRTHGKAA